MIILLIVLCLLLLYIWAILPTARQNEFAQYEQLNFAHRGLHGDGVCENSLTAFSLACEKGYAIELDVQRTKDDQLVVFHDANLVRLCQQSLIVNDLTYQELCQYALPDGSTIPLFSQVLSLVAGRVPLLVEIKRYAGVTATTQLTLDALSSYKGKYIIESFDPFCLRYLKKNAPHIIRGQLSSAETTTEVSCVTAFLMRHLLINCISRPNFIAYGVRAPLPWNIQLLRKWRKPHFGVWTIRDEATYIAQKNTHVDFTIFENIPNMPTKG